MRINHNLAAMNTHRQLTSNTGAANKSLEKLSSGFRINRAGDDAAGLAISEKMRGQIRGLDQASRNAQDSISLIQTAEGALSTTHNILQRMRELAVQSSNATSTDSDRSQLQKEIDQLRAEVDRVAYSTEFNSKKLLDGSLTSTKVAQGTKAVSSILDAADTALAAGTAQGGSAITERGSVQTVYGAGYSETAFNALAEKTKVVTSVNDTFVISVNGVEHSGITIAASTGSGYTRAEFAAAVESAINSVLTTSGTKVEINQVKVSLSSDNKLKFTTSEAGRETTLTLSSGSAISGLMGLSGTSSALASFGLRGVQTIIESTIDLSAGFSTVSGESGIFQLQVGAISGTISLVSGATYSKDQLISAIQSGLNSAFGAGTVTVEDADGDGKLELRTEVKTSTFAIGSGTAANTGMANIFGVAAGVVTSGGVVNSGTSVTVSGTNTTLGYTTGINIASGVNDQFSLSVNGGVAETLTLSSRLYATKSDLVNEINNQIGSNTVLTGTVQATLGSDNKISFTSIATGSASAVAVEDPSSSNQSALGAMGYGPVVGIISGTADISSGVSLSGTLDSISNYKLNVQLGNKSATINLLNQSNINDGTTTASGLTTKDAIIKALQAELDTAFGAGAINVATRTSGTADFLRLTSITSTNKFSVSSITGFSGFSMFDSLTAATISGISGALGTTPTNVQTTGTAAADNTLATNTLLTGLSDANNSNLGLTAGNVISFKGTQMGVEFSTSLTVTATSTIGDLIGKIRDLSAFAGASVALDVANGKISITGKTGEQYDLSNITFNAQKSSTNSTAIGNFNRLLGTVGVTQSAQDAAADTSLLMQIGANQSQTVNVDINNVSASSLKVANIDVSSKAGAQSAISVLNNAIETISNERSKLGAFQNRLEYTISNLGTSSENLTASESRIRDVDMAKEMMEFTKNNILSQAAQAMLAQANQQPQGVLQLLR